MAAMNNAVHVLDRNCSSQAVQEALTLSGGRENVYRLGLLPARRPFPQGRKEFLAGNGSSGRLIAPKSAKASGRAELPEGQVAICWSCAGLDSLADELSEETPVIVRLLELPSAADLRNLHAAAGQCMLGVACANRMIAQAVEDSDVDARVAVVGPCASPKRHLDRQGLRRRLDIATDEIAVLAPEEPRRDSGHTYAAWACAVLSVAEYPVRLIVPAEGPYTREVMAFASDGGFAGMVICSTLDAAEMAAASDVALFLHERELSPVALAEAAMAGLCVVGPDTPSGRAWLTDGENGLLTPPDVPRKIAQAVLRVIEDAPLAGRLAGASRDRRGQFDPRVALAAWSGLCQELRQTVASGRA